MAARVVRMYKSTPWNRVCVQASVAGRKFGRERRDPRDSHMPHLLLPWLIFISGNGEPLSNSDNMGCSRTDVAVAMTQM